MKLHGVSSIACSPPPGVPRRLCTSARHLRVGVVLNVRSPGLLTQPPARSARCRASSPAHALPPPDSARPRACYRASAPPPSARPLLGLLRPSRRRCRRGRVSTSTSPFSDVCVPCIYRQRSKAQVTRTAVCNTATIDQIFRYTYMYLPADLQVFGNVRMSPG